MNDHLPLLWPPLESIARDITGLTDVAASDAPETSAAQPAVGAAPIHAVPDEVRAVLDRISRSRQQYRGLLPAAGDIVRLSLPCTDKPDLSTAAAFLLDRPEADDAAVWEGWLVSPETDYAGPWDVLLDARDGVADPLAGMVQAWHRVRTRIPEAPRILARLTPRRLQAIRAVATEALLQSTDRLGRPGAGRVGLRLTLDGDSVVTGQPFIGERDPRHGYQALYRQLARASLLPRDEPGHQPNSRPGSKPEDPRS